MTEQDNTVAGMATARHPHEIPDLPSLRGIRSAPRIKRDREDLFGFELDHTALRQVRAINRQINDLRQSQSELLLPMYRAGLPLFVMSRLTGLRPGHIRGLINKSRQLDPEIDIGPMPDQADADEFYQYEPSPYDGTYSEE